jgi:hypothetical protein
MATPVRNTNSGNALDDAVLEISMGKYGTSPLHTEADWVRITVASK